MKWPKNCRWAGVVVGLCGGVSTRTTVSARNLQQQALERDPCSFRRFSPLTLPKLKIALTSIKACPPAIMHGGPGSKAATVKGQPGLAESENHKSANAGHATDLFTATERQTETMFSP